MKETSEIKNEKILLVEGRDEEVFFEVLLNKIQIQNIQIISTNGKQQLSKNLPALKKIPNFHIVKSLAIIQDADSDASATFQSICATLKSNNLNIPTQMGIFTTNIPKVGIFTIPDGKNSGMLESLCLSIIKPDSIIKKCIDSFMKCILQKPQSDEGIYKNPKNIDKARCRAFLSAMEDDTTSLGIAAKKGYWNFKSDKLKSLLNFLKQI